jgi:nucleotide-binding universal stress UspA family protein
MNEMKTYGPFKRILFFTDFSDNADFAFQFAVEQARRCPESILYLLHVVPEPDAQFWKTYLYEVDDVDQKARYDMESKIHDTYQARLPDDIQMDIKIKPGNDAAGILNFAEEEKVDLIILGRQGSSSLGKVLFGNVTEKIVRKAHCPVLVIPLSFERDLEDGQY